MYYEFTRKTKYLRGGGAYPLVGFTLAEVLITLGIIGVVAALTLPSLIQNYRKQQTITGLKKAYSVINQAMKLSEIENGPYETWESGANITPRAYIQKYFLPYFKGAHLCDTYQTCGFKSNAPYKTVIGTQSTATLTYEHYRIPFITEDGIMYSISVKADNRNDEGIMIDVNGSKGPNKVGVDFFNFYRTNNGIVPYGVGLSIDEIDASVANDINCYACAAKIIKDGWQIKDNYPVRF